MLAALFVSLALIYGAASALVVRNGYVSMALRRQIADLRAQNSLLEYQINQARSSAQTPEAAQRLGLRPADPVQEVDYVALPYSPGDSGVPAAGEPAGWLASALAGLATEVVSTGGTAEASTVQGHRP